jgi:hypothetical protein
MLRSDLIFRVIWLRCSAADVNEMDERPETMSSTPVKGWEGSNSGGGVSDLSPEMGNGLYGPGTKLMKS